MTLAPAQTSYEFNEAFMDQVAQAGEKNNALEKSIKQLRTRPI